MSSPKSGQPIPASKKAAATMAATGQILSSSFLSSSPLAQQVLAHDLAACGDDSTAVDLTDDSTDGDGNPGPTLYRRPSGIAYGATRPALAGPGGPEAHPPLTRYERARSREAERSLLRDNHILPPKHQGVPEKSGWFRSLYKRLFSTKIRRDDIEAPRIAVVDADAVADADETSPLLGGGREGGRRDADLDEQWNAAVAAGQIRTTWQREAKTIATYSRSLVVTFVLQYSLTVTSIFAVAKLGTRELGAVSLATMTANITCYAPVQGLATSLDTLCAQAFGSGHKQLVGLQLQRFTAFIMLFLVPIAAVWLNAYRILVACGIEAESAALAATYLRTILLGAPAYAAFEGGKRFVQAQGLFHATTYVLLIAAPLNVLMNYTFVWVFGLGFQGAPLAVAATQNLMPLLLLLYVWRVDGSKAWGGFRRAALSNWGPMIRLALPGMIMVLAEWFAFEILTLASGRISVETLAAQSVLVTITSMTFQLSFPLSIAGSTRVANLIGAQLVDMAKVAAKVTVGGGALVGLFNAAVLVVFRREIPLLFTSDPKVIELVAKTIPVCCAMQLWDGMAAVSHGLLRGIGRQEFGGYANLVCYYLVALPISFGLGFGLNWGLTGFWVGVSFGLLLVAAVEYLFMLRYDWEKAAKEAEDRNTSG